MSARRNLSLPLPFLCNSGHQQEDQDNFSYGSDLESQLDAYKVEESEGTKEGGKIGRAKMWVLLGLSFQSLMDLTVAGISLMLGLGLFAFIASILCSAAFFQNAKELS